MDNGKAYKMIILSCAALILVIVAIKGISECLTCDSADAVYVGNWDHADYVSGWVDYCKCYIKFEDYCHQECCASGGDAVQCVLETNEYLVCDYKTYTYKGSGLDYGACVPLCASGYQGRQPYQPPSFECTQGAFWNMVDYWVCDSNYNLSFGVSYYSPNECTLITS